MRKVFIIAAFVPFFCKAQIINNSPDTRLDSFYTPVSNSEMRIIYFSAKAKNDGYALTSLAKIENENQFLPNVLASDILQSAYLIGKTNLDPALLYLIATYENTANLMDLKAGDILYEAYALATVKKNAFLLFKIATYENIENLMDAKAGDILFEAYRSALLNKDVSTLYKIAYYEQQEDIMLITTEEIKKEIAKIW